MTQRDAALMAKIDALPSQARARAHAVIDMDDRQAGQLVAVDVEPAAGGGMHITLRFECGAWDFVTAPGKDSAP